MTEAASERLQVPEQCAEKRPGQQSSLALPRLLAAHIRPSVTRWREALHRRSIIYHEGRQDTPVAWNVRTAPYSNDPSSVSDKPRAFDCRNVDEHVPASTLGLDESKAL